MNEQEKVAKAAEQVDAIIGFYIHFTIFIFVIAGLVVVNWLASPGVWWVQWPLLAWCIGVGGHALIVFGNMPNFISNWRLRKIKQLRDRM